MEDIKMAKEYVDALLNKDDVELDKFLDENLGDLKLTVKQAGVLLGIIKGVGISSYLAGLKAGKEIEKEYVKNNAFTSMKEQGLFPFGKWHKVTDGDLPKVNQKVLLQIKDEDEPIMDFYRQDGVWNFANKYEAIAWCEIPKFKV